MWGKSGAKTCIYQKKAVSLHQFLIAPYPKTPAKVQKIYDICKPKAVF